MMAHCEKANEEIVLRQKGRTVRRPAVTQSLRRRRSSLCVRLVHPGDTTVPGRLTTRALAAIARLPLTIEPAASRYASHPSIGDLRPPGYHQTYPGETETSL